jgi:hypothetical protein
MTRTVTLGAVHLTHQPHSSLSALIHRDFMIEFTSILLKPVGDLKPTRNLVGADVGATFHPWVSPQTDLDRCHGFNHGWIFIKPAPTQPLPSLVGLHHCTCVYAMGPFGLDFWSKFATPQLESEPNENFRSWTAWNC